MRRLAWALGLAAAPLALLLACTAHVESQSGIDASDIREGGLLEAAPEAFPDASSCPRRGTPVEGVGPSDFRGSLPVLAPGRILYAPSTECNPGSDPRPGVMRTLLDAEPVGTVHVCSSDARRIGPNQAVAYSSVDRAVAVAALGFSASVTVIGDQDPAWASGGSSQADSVGWWPEPDAGAEAPVSRMGDLIFTSTGLLLVGGDDARGVSVLYRRAGPRRLRSEARLEPRFKAFQAVSLASDGSVWAAGITPGDGAALLKLDANNAVDRSVGDAGVVAVPSAGNATGVGVGVDASGRVVTAVGFPRVGATAGPIVLTRFDARGLLDRSFGDGGSVSLPVEGSGYFQRTPIIVERGGGVMVAGLAVRPNGPPVLGGVVRVRPDGSVDDGFGGDSAVLYEPGADRDVDAGLAARPEIAGASSAGACDGEFAVIFRTRAYLFH